MTFTLNHAGLPFAILYGGKYTSTKGFDRTAEGQAGVCVKALTGKWPPELGTMFPTESLLSGG